MDGSLNAFSEAAAFTGASSESAVLSASFGFREGKEARSGDSWGAGSLSRTCRITSASRFLSLSRGADSSIRAALIRANVFVFGYSQISMSLNEIYDAKPTSKLPRRVTARLMTPRGPPS